ncbi:hypothetical protein [Limihaloglobus sulfuriphilus]|uniref:hypothetical protein n=1 Tax=Limihaloglobus sulfuriphilus TaxID=1851148 RepID=UPI00202A3456|nr:hypothetical protein [Limihaloglobus sulfuriphilus]
MKTDPHWQGPAVSHERIYQHIWQDKARGETLYTHLRIAGTKNKEENEETAGTGRGTIKNRVGIEKKRPPVVERKNRIGDWEGDTVVGKKPSGSPGNPG